MSLKRPVLHCLVIHQVGSFSYTLRAGICLVVCWVTRYVLESLRSFGGWGVSLTRSLLESARSIVGLGVLHGPYNRSSDGELTRPALDSVSLFVGWGISYRPRDGISLVFRWGVSSFVEWRVSLTRPVLESISYPPLPTPTPFWNAVVHRVRSFSHTSRLEICLVVRYMGSL